MPATSGLCERKNNGLALIALVIGAVVLLFAFARKGRGRGPRKAAGMPIVVKTYRDNQTVANRLFQADAINMAARGYFPKSQSWAPGEWGAGAFILALLLIILMIGLIVFIYMLIVKPHGSLTVTYEQHEKSAEEKTCPRCAERVKSAALICHYCYNEFEESERRALLRI